MLIKEIFVVKKGTKVVLVITFVIVLLIVLSAYIYYQSINSSIDPRTRKARELMQQYDDIAGSMEMTVLFPLLDSAKNIYESLPDYARSFEPGVIHNNKCGILLVKAMYDSTLSESDKDYLLSLSMQYCDSGIVAYKLWLSEWENLSEVEIADKLSLLMKNNDPAFEGHNFKRIFDKRIKDIRTAQYETTRRLSVTLCNKGTIYRHMLEPDSALAYYRKSLELWEDNRTAESNLSVLLGGEPVKPSFIESLFPRDKDVR